MHDETELVPFTDPSGVSCIRPTLGVEEPREILHGIFLQFKRRTFHDLQSERPATLLSS